MAQDILIPTGTFGVNLFFVLSGFLITSILLKARSSPGAHGGTILKNFIARRFLRIFPAYYLLLAFLLIINYSNIRATAWYFLFYASNILVYKAHSWNAFSHTWSLAVEEQFYLVWPVLILFVSRKYIKQVIFAFIGIGIVSTFLVLKEFNGFSSVLAPNCFDAFGIGALYAYVLPHSTYLKKFQHYLRIAFPIAIIIYLFWKVAPFIGVLPHFNFFSRTIDSIISVGIINLVVFNKSPWVGRHIWGNRALNYIGSISYGIYLYHYTLDPMYNNFVGRMLAAHRSLPLVLGNFYFAFAAKLILLFVICYLSYELFEKPIMKLKSFFEYNDEGGKRRKYSLHRIFDRA